MAPTATAEQTPAAPAATTQEREKRVALLLVLEAMRGAEFLRCARCRRKLIREEDGTMIFRSRSLRFRPEKGELALRCPACGKDNKVELA
jgi:uncharacterized C2H2 Zn-finger protein